MVNRRNCSRATPGCVAQVSELVQTLGRRELSQLVLAVASRGSSSRRGKSTHLLSVRTSG